jgi:tetratricopeptide (TPR) repeat protein
MGRMGFPQKILNTALLVACLLTGAVAAGPPSDPPGTNSPAVNSPEVNSPATNNPIVNSSEINSPAIKSDDPVTEPSHVAPPSDEQLGLSDTFDINFSIENYQSAIEQQESEAGPYDPALSELSFGLGNVLLYNHRYADAISAYKRSIHLHRVNDGVYSPSQAPMLRGIIKSHLKLGQIKEASQNYRQLFWLHAKTYGEKDPRLIPLMNEIGQWHLKAYAETGLQEDVYHLQTASHLYLSAIELTTEALGSFSLQLVGPLNNLALTSYYFALHQWNYPDARGNNAFAPFGYRSFGYRSFGLSEETLRRGNFYLNGLNSYKKTLEIFENNPDAPVEKKAATHAQLGDWHLLFGYQDLAMDAYHQAHSSLKGIEQKDVILETLFGTPKMLPITQKQTFKPPSVDSSAQRENPEHDDTSLFIEPYVKVAIDVTPEGRVTEIDILKTHPENAPGLEARVKRSLRTSKFRPRFTDGHAVLTNDYPIKMLTPN